MKKEFTVDSLRLELTQKHRNKDNVKKILEKIGEDVEDYVRFNSDGKIYMWCYKDYFDIKRHKPIIYNYNQICSATKAEVEIFRLKEKVVELLKVSEPMDTIEIDRKLSLCRSINLSFEDFDWKFEPNDRFIKYRCTGLGDGTMFNEYKSKQPKIDYFDEYIKDSLFRLDDFKELCYANNQIFKDFIMKREKEIVTEFEGHSYLFSFKRKEGLQRLI